MPATPLSPPTTPYYGGGQVANPANVIFGTVSPPSNNAATGGGIIYINTTTGDVYVSYKAGAWSIAGSQAGGVATLTGDSGGAISPSTGNINLLGTANQITTTGAGSTITWSLPAAITAPGSLTTTTSLTAGSGFTVSAGAVTVTSGTSAINISADAAATTVNLATGAAAKTLTIGSTNTTSATTIQSGSGNVTISGGSLKINSAAKQLQVHGGAVTDFIGQAVLVNGTVTVANTNIAATDRIFVTRSAKNGSTAYGTFITGITAATSFTITSAKSDTTTETNDASTVDYFIVRQL